MKILFCIGLAWIGLALPPTAKAEEDPAAIDPDKRRQAIAALADELRAFQPTGEVRRADATINPASDNRGAVCRVIGSGLVEMGTNGWVYLVLRSSHQDPAVGDVILAIDDRGRLLESSGHVCGKVAHFVSAEKRAAEDPDDFFERFRPDPDRAPWVPLGN